MSSDKPYDGPFIVHSAPPNAREPYKGSSPIVHPTQLEPYNDEHEPIYLPETSPPPTEVSTQPPCQEIDFLGISIGISRGIEGLNCTEWTVLLDRLDTGTNPEAEPPNVCRAYTIDSGPKDGFDKEYKKHIRIDMPFHSVGASNNYNNSSSSSSAYEILIPCGILHRDFLPLFDRIFWVTRSGPNNYFILRFLRMLGAYGLVCEGDVLMALEYLGLEKRYNAMEIECFKGLLTAEDYNYVLGFMDYPFGYQVFF